MRLGVGQRGCEGALSVSGFHRYLFRAIEYLLGGSKEARRALSRRGVGIGRSRGVPHDYREH